MIMIIISELIRRIKSCGLSACICVKLKKEDKKAGSLFPERTLSITYFTGNGFKTSKPTPINDMANKKMSLVL